MSSFYDDLLTSDDLLANADPRTDKVVLDVLMQSAADGSVRTLRQAIERGQINRETDQNLVDAVVHVIGNDREANRLTPKEREKRAIFVAEWVNAVAGPRPDQKNDPSVALEAWNCRTGSMLNACFSKYMHSHDHVASELIKMGVPTNGKFESEKPDRDAMTPLAGARLATFQEASSVTVLARAIETRSRLVQNIIAADAQALPIVARVKVGNQSQEVNAAGYALVLGDAKVLRDVVRGLSSRLNLLDVQQKMGQAIAQAESLGLLDFGPDEVLHGVVGLIAAGAELKNPLAFFSRTITLVDMPGLANDSLATPAQAKDVQDAVRTSTCTLPSAMLHAPDSNAVCGAISALSKMGWDVNQLVCPASNGLSASNDQAKDLRTCAHVAAFRGDAQVVNALQNLGSDFNRDDGAGRKPIDYARFGARSRGESLDIDFARMMDPKYELQPGDVATQAKKTPTENVNDLSTSKGHAAEKYPEYENSLSSRLAPSTSKTDDFDDVNALAMLAFNENNDNNPTTEIDYANDVGIAHPKPHATAQTQAPSQIAPTEQPKPLTKFQLLQQAQAARKAIPKQAEATPGPRP